MAEKKKLGPGRHLTTIKRDRQNKRHAARNKAARSEVRTLLKKTLKAIEAQQIDSAKSLLNQTRSHVDRAVKRGLYHARTGQRMVARLSRRVHRLSA